VAAGFAKRFHQLFGLSQIFQILTRSRLAPRTHDQFVNRISRRLGDEDGDSALVQQNRPDRLMDKKVQEAQRFGHGAAK
jgi:hypothetical protein